MMISGLGAGSLADSLIRNNAPRSTSDHSISLTNDSINFVMDAATNATLSTNENYLMYNLEPCVLGSGSLAGVQDLVDAYTSSLPSSNVYMSSYTIPSAKFLNDLQTLKSAANTGNLAEAKSALEQAKADAPDSVADGQAEAVAKGDTTGEASLLMEANANMADGLVAEGYTPVDAQTEANAITINGFFVDSPTNDSKVVQSRIGEINDLARSLAIQATSTTNRTGPTANNAMIDIIESLLQAPSADAKDQTLASLDKSYGTNGSAFASSASSHA